MNIFTSLAGPKVDKNKLSFDILKYSVSRIALVIMEKDKGGTGSTGSAMTLIELLLWLSVRVHLVDCADTQLDLATPYEEIEGVTVHNVPMGDRGAEGGSVLRALTAAQPGEVIIVQYPGSSIDRIDGLHQLLVHAQARLELPVDVCSIWTMDSDRNSRDLLKLTLDTALPGTMHVNWPVWNGEPDIAPELAEEIAAQGGTVFSLPALDPKVYRAFKADRLAPRQLYLDGDFAQRMELDFWCASVAAAVGARW